MLYGIFALPVRDDGFQQLWTISLRDLSILSFVRLCFIIIYPALLLEHCCCKGNFHFDVMEPLVVTVSESMPRYATVNKMPVDVFVDLDV